MEFEFATATRIVFGSGTLAQAAASAEAMGQRTLLVTGSTPERTEPLQHALARRHVGIVIFSIRGEPTIDTALRGMQLAQSEQCDMVIGMGGGSALDAAKAVAALLSNGGVPLDYLEVIGRGMPLTCPSAPMIAIPTTAGTGAEVTCNSVLGVPEHRIKVSLRSPLMLPQLAVVDPQLTFDLRPDLSATTGMDALTQVLEPFVSHKSNPLTDAICRQGLRCVAHSLRTVCQDQRNVAAREEMALASLLGGLALANAKLGAVHGIAGPLGGQFPAPHGATCASLLAPVMEINLRALNAREPENPALPRYEEVARILTGNPHASAMDGAKWVNQLCKELQIPPLSSCGLKKSDFPTLIVHAARSSSMQGNPIELTENELSEILDRAVG